MAPTSCQARVQEQAGRRAAGPEAGLCSVPPWAGEKQRGQIAGVRRGLTGAHGSEPSASPWGLALSRQGVVVPLGRGAHSWLRAAYCSTWGGGGARQGQVRGRCGAGAGGTQQAQPERSAHRSQRSFLCSPGEGAFRGQRVYGQERTERRSLSGAHCRGRAWGGGGAHRPLPTAALPGAGAGRGGGHGHHFLTDQRMAFSQVRNLETVSQNKGFERNGGDETRRCPGLGGVSRHMQGQEAGWAAAWRHFQCTGSWAGLAAAHLLAGILSQQSRAS